MIQELSIAVEWLKKGYSVSIAAVLKTWGSAPRREGSLMVIRADEKIEGSISGGCIESEVIMHGLTHKHSDGVKVLNYAVSTNSAWQAGLACGGEIDIALFSIQASDVNILEDLLKTVTIERKASLLSIDCTHGHIHKPHPTPNAPAIEMTGTCLNLKVSPKPNLVIIGAVHIAKALASFATTCGHTVTIIDPRGIFTDGREFANAKIIHDWPDEHFTKNPLDMNTALVTLTHDPKLDDAALRHALKSGVYYIGSLGSRATHASRLERLAPDFKDTDLKRIHGPVGLSIGSATPEEIATSIMAELIAVKRGHSV